MIWQQDQGNQQHPGQPIPGLLHPHDAGQTLILGELRKALNDYLKKHVQTGLVEAFDQEGNRETEEKD